MSLILSGSDGLSDVDGSASTPAIRGTDANTGIFFPAADTIAFGEGGSEAMRIDSSGNVGIGTTSPTQKLDVSGNIRSFGTGTPSLIAENTSTGDSYVDFRSNSALQARLYYSSSIFGITAVPAIPMVFKTTDAERARITSGGAFLINTTSQNDSGQLSVTAASGQNGIGLSVPSTSETGNIIFRNPNGVVGRIYTTNSTTTYATSSDYRLKENVQPMTGALARVSELKPCTYKWKVDGTDGQGFIAHELQAVVPDCVSGEKDAVDAEGKPIYQGIDTSFLVATLTAAIQELKAELDAAKARIAVLEAK